MSALIWKNKLVSSNTDWKAYALSLWVNTLWLVCRIGSQACDLLHLSHWTKTPWLIKFYLLAVKAITSLRPSLYSYYPPVLDMAMKFNLNPV